MQTRLLRISILVLSACAAVAPGQMPTKKPMAMLFKSIASVPAYSEVAISPDRQFIAWVEATSDANKPLALGSAVYIAPVSRPGGSGQVTAIPSQSHPDVGSVHEKAIAWSRDSKSIAFLSDARTSGQQQLYVMTLADRAVRQLTSVKGTLGSPQWSPDGHFVAILFTQNAVREAGPLAAVAAPTGVIEEEISEQRLATVEVATGTMNVVSPGDLYVYEYDWSPDGTRFVVTAAHGSGDNNWYVAEIYTIGTVDGMARSLLKPGVQVAVPRWSPDGRHIAFIAGLMSDEGIASGDVHIISSSGNDDRNVTPQLDGSAFWLTWLPNSRDILIAEALDGGSAAAEVNSQAGSLRLLWQGAETLRGPADFARGLSVAADGTTSAVIRETFNQPPGIWVGPIGKWRGHTGVAVSADLAPWGKAENIRWQSGEFSVQGWLVPPEVIDPGRKYPLVVWVHGGPAWLTAPSWPRPLEDPVVLLAGQGYYVFFPNPRGSAGSGERFKRANVKDFGGGDLRDILSGIEKVVATHPIDDNRVGITGWSYGGFMTMWAITQTHRFRAAVVGAGLANWLSYYGENGIDEWMIPYFGASVYDDPQVYAKSSPINFVKEVRTPTLLVVGDSDVECPPPQSYEYWHALKSLNVKTQLVVYPHEGHQFSDPAHALDVMERMVAWFDTNMP
jgi:dipeptidyl aminopeptidase/acylaminoacyl peptidase